MARPSLHVLVMQYIQRCGGSGLVHETSQLHGSVHFIFVASFFVEIQIVYLAGSFAVLNASSNNLLILFVNFHSTVQSSYSTYLQGSCEALLKGLAGTRDCLSVSLQELQLSNGLSGTHTPRRYRVQIRELKDCKPISWYCTCPRVLP